MPNILYKFFKMPNINGHLGKILKSWFFLAIQWRKVEWEAICVLMMFAYKGSVDWKNQDFAECLLFAHAQQK